jgi:hypothetical protein
MGNAVKKSGELLKAQMTQFTKFDTQAFLGENVLKDQNQPTTLDVLDGDQFDLQKYVSKLSPSKRDLYEERAAILEFEAGLERQQAEKESRL